MGWDQDRLDTLRRLWLEGKSASEIAKKLGGVSRNAVIGKVHRLGIAGRAAPASPAQAAEPRGPKAPRAFTPEPPKLPKVRVASGDRRAYTAPPALPLPATPPEDIALAPRPWESRLVGECAFLIGDDGVACCNPTAALERGMAPYCAAHDRLMRKPGTSMKVKTNARQIMKMAARYG